MIEKLNTSTIASQRVDRTRTQNFQDSVNDICEILKIALDHREEKEHELKVCTNCWKIFPNSSKHASSHESPFDFLSFFSYFNFEETKNIKFSTREGTDFYRGFLNKLLSSQEPTSKDYLFKMGFINENWKNRRIYIKPFQMNEDRDCKEEILEWEKIKEAHSRPYQTRHNRHRDNYRSSYGREHRRERGSFFDKSNTGFKKNTERDYSRRESMSKQDMDRSRSYRNRWDFKVEEDCEDKGMYCKDFKRNSPKKQEELNDNEVKNEMFSPVKKLKFTPSKTPNEKGQKIISQGNRELMKPVEIVDMVDSKFQKILEENKKIFKLLKELQKNQKNIEKNQKTLEENQGILKKFIDDQGVILKQSLLEEKIKILKLTSENQKKSNEVVLEKLDKMEKKVVMNISETEKNYGICYKALLFAERSLDLKSIEIEKIDKKIEEPEIN